MASVSSYGRSHAASPVASTSTSTLTSTGAASARSAAPIAGLEESELFVDLASHLLECWTKPHESFSDCALRVAYADGSEGVFHLHGLMISRSPLLRDLLTVAFPSSTHRPLVIPLAFSDPSITLASLSLVLASLYSPTVLAHLNQSTAPEVLATASLLGLDQLAQRAMQLCEDAIARASTADEIRAWVRYIDRDAGAATAAGARPSYAGQSASPVPGQVNGVAKPDGESLSPYTGSVNGGWTEPYGGPGAAAGAARGYESRLRLLLTERVLRLPREMGAFEPAMAAGAQGHIIAMLSQLPFEMFKAAIEDTRFEVPTDLDRFNFAKKVVAARKQQAGAAEFEETVVLQFGASGGAGAGCAVNVLRKPRKPTLWKASSAM